MDEREVNFEIAAAALVAFMFVLLLIAFALENGQAPPNSVPPWPDIDGTITTVRD